MCHYFRISKSFMLERAMSRLSVEIFLSRIIKTLRRGTLLCFTNFLVSNFFMEKRGRRRRKGVNIKIFRSNFFVTSVENFRRGIFWSLFYFGYRKMSSVREGG